MTTISFEVNIPDKDNPLLQLIGIANGEPFADNIDNMLYDAEIASPYWISNCTDSLILQITKGLFPCPK